MTARTVTGNILQITGAVSPNAFFTVTPVDAFRSTDIDSLMIGESLQVTSDSSGDFSFAIEEGEYLITARTVSGIKTRSMTVDSVGPWTIGRLIGVSGPVSATLAQQVIARHIENYASSAAAAQAGFADALEAAIAAGRRHVIFSQPGVYLADRRVVLPSNFTVFVMPGTTLRAAAGVPQMFYMPPGTAATWADGGGRVEGNGEAFDFLVISGGIPKNDPEFDFDSTGLSPTTQSTTTINITGLTSGWIMAGDRLAYRDDGVEYARVVMSTVEIVGGAATVTVNAAPSPAIGAGRSIFINQVHNRPYMSPALIDATTVTLTAAQVNNNAGGWMRAGDEICLHGDNNNFDDIEWDEIYTVTADAQWTGAYPNWTVTVNLNKGLHRAVVHPNRTTSIQGHRNNRLGALILAIGTQDCGVRNLTTAATQLHAVAANATMYDPIYGLRPELNPNRNFKFLDMHDVSGARGTAYVAGWAKSITAANCSGRDGPQRTLIALERCDTAQIENASAVGMQRCVGLQGSMTKYRVTAQAESCAVALDIRARTDNGHITAVVTLGTASLYGARFQAPAGVTADLTINGPGNPIGTRAGSHVLVEPVSETAGPENFSLKLVSDGAARHGLLVEGVAGSSVTILPGSSIRNAGRQSALFQGVPNLQVLGLRSVDAARLVSSAGIEIHNCPDATMRDSSSVGAAQPEGVKLTGTTTFREYTNVSPVQGTAQALNIASPAVLLPAGEVPFSHFGPTGNGTANDQRALRDAAQSGLEVTFGPGYYRAVGSVNLVNGTKWRGCRWFIPDQNILSRNNISGAVLICDFNRTTSERFVDLEKGSSIENMVLYAPQQPTTRPTDWTPFDTPWAIGGGTFAEDASSVRDSYLRIERNLILEFNRGITLQKGGERGVIEGNQGNAFTRWMECDGIYDSLTLRGNQRWIHGGGTGSIQTNEKVWTLNNLTAYGFGRVDNLLGEGNSASFCKVALDFFPSGAPGALADEASTNFQWNAPSGDGNNCALRVAGTYATGALVDGVINGGTLLHKNEDATHMDPVMPNIAIESPFRQITISQASVASTGGARLGSIAVVAAAQGDLNFLGCNFTGWDSADTDTPAFVQTGTASRINVEHATYKAAGGAEVSVDKTVSSGRVDYVTRPRTFAPTLTFGTPGNVAWDYTMQDGMYKADGAFIDLDIRLIATPTWTTASGELRIGVPILDIGSGALTEFQIDWYTNVSPETRNNLTGRYATGDTFIRLFRTGGPVDAAALLETSLTSGSTIQLFFSGRLRRRY